MGCEGRARRGRTLAQDRSLTTARHSSSRCHPRSSQGNRHAERQDLQSATRCLVHQPQAPFLRTASTAARHATASGHHKPDSAISRVTRIVPVDPCSSSSDSSSDSESEQASDSSQASSPTLTRPQDRERRRVRRARRTGGYQATCSSTAQSSAIVPSQRSHSPNVVTCEPIEQPAPAPVAAPVKAKRGRPPKDKSATVPAAVKRKPGRPPKVQPQPATADPEIPDFGVDNNRLLYYHLQSEAQSKAPALPPSGDEDWSEGLEWLKSLSLTTAQAAADGAAGLLMMPEFARPRWSKSSVACTRSPRATGSWASS